MKNLFLKSAILSSSIVFLSFFLSGCEEPDKEQAITNEEKQVDLLNYVVEKEEVVELKTFQERYKTSFPSIIEFKPTNALLRPDFSEKGHLVSFQNLNFKVLFLPMENDNKNAFSETNQIYFLGLILNDDKLNSRDYFINMILNNDVNKHQLIWHKSGVFAQGFTFHQDNLTSLISSPKEIIDTYPVVLDRGNCFFDGFGQCGGAILGSMTDGSFGGTVAGLTCMAFSAWCAGGITIACGFVGIGMCER